MLFSVPTYVLHEGTTCVNALFLLCYFCGFVRSVKIPYMLQVVLVLFSNSEMENRRWKDHYSVTNVAAMLF